MIRSATNSLFESLKLSEILNSRLMGRLTRVLCSFFFNVSFLNTCFMQECEQDITVGLANVTAVKIKEQAVGRGSEIKLFKV